MSTPQAPQSDRLEQAALDLSVGQETARIVFDLLEEMERAETKFPNQHMPDGTPAFADRMGHDAAREQAERTRSMYQYACRTADRDGTVTWRHVLTEEFYEALAENRPERLRAKLVQVAAVAMRWIKDIDRRRALAEPITARDEALPAGGETGE